MGAVPHVLNPFQHFHRVVKLIRPTQLEGWEIKANCREIKYNF